MAVLKSINTIPVPKKSEATSMYMMDTPCLRAEYLVEKDSMYAVKRDWNDCMRRQDSPGYAKIKDTKYNGGVE